MTKVLCLIPPHIPSYFNAGHHLAIFLVASYLRKNFPQCRISVQDAAALNITWKEVCDFLLEKYDIIYTMFDYDSVDTCERFVHYVKTLAPTTQLVAFGRLVKEIPGFFLRRGFHAAHVSGDFECGASAYLKYYLNSDDRLKGVLMQENFFLGRKCTLGDILKPEDWVLPDVTEIPYAAYGALYKNDLNKFCGIPDRQELVLPIARGCPVGCYYCDVPTMQGHIERRLSVDSTLAYLSDACDKLPFEYFTFYAPTFTLNKKWVLEFCDKYIKLGKPYPWKCVTVLKTLSTELLTNMASAGCLRISFGIESFDTTAANDLPRVKQDSLDHFEAICNLATQLGVEINVFLILGLPGDQSIHMQKTIATCLKQGIRIRPTLYTPYQQLREDMSVLEVANFNRQLFLPGLLPEEEAGAYYNIFYKNAYDKKTNIMDKINIRQ